MHNILSVDGRGATQALIATKIIQVIDEKLKKVVQKNASNNATSSMHTKMKKIKPNAPCPCGSGKKYKKCCK